MFPTTQARVLTYTCLSRFASLIIIINFNIMFGKNFKYVLVLGFLASFVYTSPAVLDSISSGIANTNEQAAIWDSWFGFGNQINTSATFGSANLPRPPHPLGSTTAQFASSTFPMMNGDHNNQGKPRLLNPQDVISILAKAGIISADKVDQARQLFPQPPQAGSSTPGVKNGVMSDRGMVGSTTPPNFNASRPPQQSDNFGSSTIHGQRQPPPSRFNQ